MHPSIVKVLVPATVAFVIGIASTPIVTHYLYKYKVWKKVGGKTALDGSAAHEFNRLHGDGETKTPRMGGIVIWGSVFITTLCLALLAGVFPESAVARFDFLTRSETWIPLFTLVIGAIVGFLNDLLDVVAGGKGLTLKARLLVVVILSGFIGWWFYAKLAVTAINIPFAAPLQIGWLIIPLFIAISLCLYASGVIDGIDGLSGGIFASIFASYAIIAFAEGQFDLAAFCATMVGGLLAFLWFNVPPARFYMSETGTMGITLTIASVAFLTDGLGRGIGVAVLPIIGALLVITVASNVLQILWKKMFGKKLLRIAPLHHHFEAIGWPGSKVVMRYWILSVIFAFAGVILALSVLPPIV
jgi:phospho-N-acetylmuramoyl-pentapeptide-transferase